jgi:hypothetical protein
MPVNDAVTRRLWDASVRGVIDPAMTKVAEEFGPWEPAPGIPESTEAVPLGDEHRLALDGAAGVLLASLRNMIVTVTYSKICGCPRCTKRIEVIYPVYTETLQALRCMGAIRRMDTVVAVAADTERHVVIH